MVKTDQKTWLLRVQFSIVNRGTPKRALASGMLYQAILPRQNLLFQF